MLEAAKAARLVVKEPIRSIRIEKNNDHNLRDRYRVMIVMMISKKNSLKPWFPVLASWLVRQHSGCFIQLFNCQVTDALRGPSLLRSSPSHEPLMLRWKPGRVAALWMVQVRQYRGTCDTNSTTSLGCSVDHRSSPCFEWTPSRHHWLNHWNSPATI